MLSSDWHVLRFCFPFLRYVYYITMVDFRCGGTSKQSNLCYKVFVDFCLEALMPARTTRTKKSVKKLATSMEAYRLWFEYLKVAKSLVGVKTTQFDASVKKKVDQLPGAFKICSTFYDPWEISSDTKFDPWWEKHRHLFEEKHIVRILKDGEEKSDPNSILIEVPLNRSITELSKEVTFLIKSVYGAKRTIQGKNKTQSNALYTLSKGSEPKLEILRDMLNIFRDVYLKNPKLRGEQLVSAVHAYYNKRTRYKEIPKSLVDRHVGITEETKRNTRRYINNAAQILVNVAAGQFPGKY